MTRRIRDPHAKEQLVNAARELVAGRGVTATTLRAIAAHAEVTTGSVMHYFEDKAELMEAVMRENSRRATEHVVKTIGEHKGLEAVERATLGLLPLDEDRLTCWRIWLAFWSQSPEDGAQRSFGEGYRAWSDRVREHLVEAIDEGDLPEGIDPRHEVGVLGTLVTGMSLLARSDTTDRDQLHRKAKRVLDEHLARLSRIPNPVRP